MSSPIVKLRDGFVIGNENVTQSGTKYLSFQGMRYAKPPIYDGRFKDPKPPSPWSGLYDATYEGDICLQVNSQYEVIGNEDCLFINVYIPKLPRYFQILQLLLPVMVWIHGGGYISGSGNKDLFGPSYFVENNVILVTMNYRLGVMGFMNLKIEAVPGNGGLKDQVMALKWVQENIKEFSGNRHRVTIFGESTGGASVQYLMLTPMAKQLFHQAVSHSGSCLSSWSFLTEHVDTFEKAVDLARLSGRTSENPIDLLGILQNLPAEELVVNANKLRTFDEKMRDSAFVFAPSVEKVIGSSENFLTQDPLKIFMSGMFTKVPYISGFNSDEGIYYIKYARSNKGHMDELNKNFQYVVPADMNLMMDSKESIDAAMLIKAFYFQDKVIDNSTMRNYIDLYTDYAFLYKIIQSFNLIKHHSTAPVYFYEFSFDGDFNYFKINNNLNYSGACHLDDLGYIFQENHDESKASLMSKTVRKRMVTMWTNFAKFGNPTPKMTTLLPTLWKVVTNENLDYLDIKNTLKMRVNPQKIRMIFWDLMYRTFSNNSELGTNAL